MQRIQEKSIWLVNFVRVRTLDKNDDTGNLLYIYVTKKCDWLNNACKELACSDLICVYYNTDANCAAELSACLNNRVDAWRRLKIHYSINMKYISLFNFLQILSIKRTW